MNITIHTDGGSRGNPGPAGIGVVIQGGDKEKEYYEFIGEATNNEAEYRGLILALKKVKSVFGKEEAYSSDITVYVDSELIAKQLNGEYKIKDEKIQPLYLEAHNLMVPFESIEVVSVPREENKRADALANQALDEELSQKKLI